MAGRLRRDLEYAGRGLRSSPGLTAAAVLSLAIGIGVTSSAFTLLNAMILRDLPGVVEQDRLTTLGLELPGRGGARWAHPDVLAAREAPGAFQALAAAGGEVVALDVGSGPERVTAEFATGNYFRVLGTRAVVGRLFSHEDADTPEGEAVVVLSHRVWRLRLGSDPGVVGRRVRVNGSDFVVIGVAPAGFTGMVPGDVTQADGGGPDLWIPLTAVGITAPAERGEELLHSLEARWLRVVARGSPGATTGELTTSAEAFGRLLERAYPAERAGASVDSGDLVFGPGAGAWRPSLTIIGFMVVPFLVLLIACANVANLTLARGIARRRQLAIQLSLGATRSRIVGQLLLETLLLALAGGAGGLVLAIWAGDLASFFSLRLLVDAPVDLRVLGFTLAVSLAVGVVFGTIPGLQVARVAPASVLTGGFASGLRGDSRLRNGLVVAQIALSFVLLTLSGLFVRSVGHGLRLETGLDEQHLLLVAVETGLAGDGPERREARLSRVREGVRGVPGVVEAGWSADPPLLGLRRARVAPPEGSAEWGRTVGLGYVGPGWFEAAGLPPLAGRAFQASDASTPPQTAVVSEALAGKQWPGASPLGRRLRVGDGEDGFLVEVVGVVADRRATLVGGAEPALYLPAGAPGLDHPTLFVRTAGTPRAAAPAIREVIRRVAPDLPLGTMETMVEVRRRELLPWRLTAAGMGVLGAVALLLASLGLYGVTAYAVGRRRREIGVRVALGASRRRVLGQVLRASLGLALSGVAAGAVGAALLSALVRKGLFGVAPLDPLTYGGIALVLAATAMVASVVPAWNAAGVEPTVAIRDG